MTDGKIRVGIPHFDSGFLWEGTWLIWDGCDEGIRVAEAQYEGIEDENPDPYDLDREKILKFE